MRRRSVVGLALAFAGVAAVDSYRAGSGDGGRARVRSPEHGHWHSVGGGRAPSGPVPRPPGPAPPGKVWSPEHGHRHDAP